MELCKADTCYGCYACYNICPNNSISFSKDAFGFIFPQIDSDTCVECGGCRRVCPVLSPITLEKPDSAYAVWSNDKKIVSNAASAGLVTSIAKEIVEAHGVVFGTYFVDGELRFSYTENVVELSKFQGSKYIQAHVYDSFYKVKQFLISERKVLFVGTPCQVAGLRNYLRREYSNLYTIDLVCHGVSSSDFMDSYLNDIKVGSYTNIHFKGKYGSSLVVEKHSKVLYKKDKQLDIFFKAYAKGYIHKASCYSCPFAQISRTGDLTAGDFWGLDHSTLLNSPDKIKYISLALTNTDKGRNLLFSNKSLTFEERTIEEATKHNRQLAEPCSKPLDFDLFRLEFIKLGFVEAIKRTKYYREFIKEKYQTLFISFLSKCKHLIVKWQKF